MSKAALFASTFASTLLLVGLTSTAHAGGYISLGVGSDAEIEGDMGGMFDAQGSNHGRLSIGQRTGPIAIEASLFGTGLHSVSGAETDYSTVSLGVGIKYYVSLTGPIEAYGRGGLNKTWLVADTGSTSEGSLESEGRGYDLGVGLQYSFRLMPLGEAAVWLDYTHQTVDLHASDRDSIEGSVNLLTVGLSVGL